MSQPLSILVDARMVSVQIHGIARYVIDLIRGLARLNQNISIMATDDSTVAQIGSDYIQDVIRCNSQFVSTIETLELSWKARNKNFDITHFPSFSVPTVLPKRTVITIHDLIHLHPPRNLLHYAYYNTILRRALRGCDRVIAVSEWTKLELQKYLSTPSSKIDVVRNGIDGKWFSKQAIQNDVHSGPYFICLSNPKPHKNVRTLIDACELLWDRGKVFGLVLSLGGYDFPSEWTIKHKKNILLLRKSRDEEIVSFLGSAKALISTSFLEGFNYPAAEMLALGGRVIVSENSANTELKGDNLVFYKPADDVSRLASLLSEELERSGPFSFYTHNVRTGTQMAQDTLDVYKKALSLSNT